MVTSHTPPTGDLACNPGMSPDWESNRQPFSSQASTQSTEPHQPGLTYSHLTVVLDGDLIAEAVMSGLFLLD